MKSTLVKVFGGGVCLLLAACSGTAPELGEGEVRAREEALYIRDVTLFTSNNFQVVTCFTGGTTDARTAVRTAVEGTWEEYTMLNISGWGECPSSGIPSTTVPIRLVAGTNQNCGGGVAKAGLGGRLPELPGYQVDITYCPDLRGLRQTAVHELGHVIGWVHEHQRPDRASTVAACEAQYNAAFPGEDLQFEIIQTQWVGTVYDPKSIMNYCRDWNGNGTPDGLESIDEPWNLSSQDIMGARLIYGEYDSGADLSVGAFAHSHNLSGTFQADGTHTFSTAGFLPATVTRESAGTYRVDFPRQASLSGNFQVSAFNSPNRCKVHDWSTSGTTQQVRVKCRTPAGTAANTLFNVKYLRRSDEYGWEAAYVYANQPSAASYTATGTYTYNSQGFVNTIQRTGTGAYTVRLLGQEGPAGDRGGLEVTAVGTGNEYCVVYDYYDDDGDEVVLVRCFNTTGAAADSQFMLNYGHQSTSGTLSWADVAASNPSTASYTPVRQRSLNFNNNCTTAAGPTTITRTATGRYDVNFKGMWTSSSGVNLMGRSIAKVTGRNTTNVYCNPMSTTSGTDTHVVVQCYNASGTATDGNFLATLGTTYTGSCF